MIGDMEDMQKSASFFHFLRAAWVIWAMGLVFAAGIFLSAISLTEGAHGLEVVILLAAGILGGGLVRGLIRARWVTIILILVVALEGFVLSQASAPWSKLWPVLVPASAIGVMVGNVLRLGVLDARGKVARDV